MDPSLALKKKVSKFISSKPIGEYSEDSVKKMAVLFTDIVGSSQFFKSQGDMAGREMLRRHQEMASSAVIEHGGVVVKVLGDSIMAYFLNPKEALKSAIKIQQKFQGHNERKNSIDQIHVRICIHFGDGIVEDKDIFGDVVNMAAKFLPFAGGDQVFISHELYKAAQGLPSLHFESVDLSGKKDLLKGLTVYNVVWDDNISFDPYVKTLLYFKPVWELGKSKFANAWETLIDKKGNLWNDKVEKESILSDKSIALIVKDAPTSLHLSKYVMKFLNAKLGQDSLPFLPLQIIIDSGPYMRAGKLILEGLKVDWEEIKPGNIYVSFSAYKTIGDSDTVSIFPKPDEKRPQAFYKLNLDNQQKEDHYLFLYQDSLAQGKNPPCFYCGDRRHSTDRCPSKQITGLTQCLKDLGYLPLEEINKLFFNYLTKTGLNFDADAGPSNKSVRPSQWAQYGFYELKTVFQLRLLRSIWNSREDSWNRIKEKKNEGVKGGLIWLGQDCIRVSNHDQAENILSKAMEKHPYDYRVHCAMGFLNVEKKDFSRAKNFFNKARENAETRPQKIFTLFLLMRLYEMTNDRAKAEDHLRKILYLDPYCYEAVYQDIIFQFRLQKSAEALRRLIKLIKNKNEYYIISIIDPELAEYSKIIHPEIKNLLDEARTEAKHIREQAEVEVKNLERHLTQEEKERSNPQALWARIEELSKIDSYFSYTDIIQHSGSILNIGRRFLEGRRTRLLRVLNKLKPRIENCLIFVNNFPNRNLIKNVSQRLQAIQATMNKSWDIARASAPEKYKDAFTQANKVSKELKQIESELKRLDKIRQMILFITKFFKKSLIFQSANLIVAIFLFPIFAYYLNFIIPDLRITPQNIWTYQKVVMVLGGLSGLFLALLLATKNMPKE